MTSYYSPAGRLVATGTDSRIVTTSGHTLTLEENGELLFEGKPVGYVDGSTVYNGAGDVQASARPIIVDIS